MIYLLIYIISIVSSPSLEDQSFIYFDTQFKAVKVDRYEVSVPLVKTESIEIDFHQVCQSVSFISHFLWRKEKDYG